MNGRQYTIRSVLIATVILAIIFALGRFAITSLVDRHRAAVELDALLDGSEDVGLTLFATEFQMRRVRCSDKAVLAYLASQMRQSQRIHGSFGTSYRYTIGFQSGLQYTVTGYQHPGRFSLSVPTADPTENGWPTHDISLQDTMPDSAREMFAFLNASSEEVAGLTLHVEDGGVIRYEPHAPSQSAGWHRGTRVSVPATDAD